MNAAVFAGERLGLGGFALSAPFTYTILFESNKPVSNDQFFAFAEAVNRLITEDVVQIAPIDPTHFFATVNAGAPVESGDIVGEAQNIDGITFTVTGLYEGSYKRDEEEKKLSTGAMVGIGTAAAAAVGTALYLATRKKRRRRR